MIVEIDKIFVPAAVSAQRVCPAYAIVGEQGEPQTIDESRCVRCGSAYRNANPTCPVLTHGKDAYERVKKERHIPDCVQEPLFAAHAVCNVDKVKAALADKEKFTIVQCAPAVG